MIAPELWNFHCILLASFSTFSPEDVCRSFRKKLQSACRLSKSPSPRCEVARVVLTGGLHWQMPCFCRREILKVRSSCVQKRTVFILFFFGGRLKYRSRSYIFFRWDVTFSAVVPEVETTFPYFFLFLLNGFARTSNWTIYKIIYFHIIFSTDPRFNINHSLPEGFAFGEEPKCRKGM